MDMLPVLPACKIETVESPRPWLIEGLWGADSVGILGGEPKCCKTFMALSMAVAAASGKPCLGRFDVFRKGPVLLFAAEDSLPAIRDRLTGICEYHGISLSEVPIWVITAHRIRLDLAEDRRKLTNTVVKIKPVLLILDPFVRLHRIDENVSAAVVPLLAALREIQRQCGCAVLVVHHARKRSGNIRTGQALRGTSEFHAWADSSLFMRRTGGEFRLTSEHRSLPSDMNCSLKLSCDSEYPVLVIVKTAEPMKNEPVKQKISGRERVVAALESLDESVGIRELRARCRIRTETLCRILNELETSGQAEKSKKGWKIKKSEGRTCESHRRKSPQSVSVSQIPQGCAGNVGRKRSS